MSKVVKKKRKLNYNNITLTILTSILISLSIAYGYKTLYLDKNMDIPSDEPRERTIIKEDKEVVYKANLVMVGDNLIHDTLIRDAHEYANYNGYDFKPMYDIIKPIISSYDLAYYNQETILGGEELGLRSYPTFNSPYEVGDAMVDAGFNLVSLATNHTMDAGEKAVLNSREYWNKQEDVLAVGSYSSMEERNEVQVREVNNIKYTMLNYTYGTNGMPVPSGKDYLVNVWPTDFDKINNPLTDTEYQNYKEQVKKDIDSVRDKVDVLIVAMHWGVEYASMPTEYQKDAAEFLASNGVDIVVGTHPHVIEPVTWIDDTLVIYSLGNFLSSQYKTDYYNKVVGLMTNLEINKDKDGKISIDNVCNELIFTYYEDVGNDLRGNIKIIPFSKMTSEYLTDYKNVYDTYKKVVQSMNSDMCVKESN